MRSDSNKIISSSYYLMLNNNIRCKSKRNSSFVGSRNLTGQAVCGEWNGQICNCVRTFLFLFTFSFFMTAFIPFLIFLSLYLTVLHLYVWFLCTPLLTSINIALYLYSVEPKLKGKSIKLCSELNGTLGKDEIMAWEAVRQSYQL